MSQRVLDDLAANAPAAATAGVRSGGGGGGGGKSAARFEPKMRTASNTVDVRGEYVHDATRTLSSFLDRQLAAGRSYSCVATTRREPQQPTRHAAPPSLSSSSSSYKAAAAAAAAAASFASTIAIGRIPIVGIVVITLRRRALCPLGLLLLLPSMSGLPLTRLTGVTAFLAQQ